MHLFIHINIYSINIYIHSAILKALWSREIGGQAIKWCGNFLFEWMQQVLVGDALSKPETVISGLIRGSVCWPIIFDLVLDSLLKSIKIPHFSFVDDVKAMADTVIYDCVSVQADLDIVNKWSSKNCMPISINKSFVLHYGNNSPCRNYELQGENLQPVENITDLGIIRTANSHSQCSYNGEQIIRCCFTRIQALFS